MSLKLKAKDEELAAAQEKLAAILLSQPQSTALAEELEPESTTEASSCATSSTSDTICLMLDGGSEQQKIQHRKYLSSCDAGLRGIILISASQPDFDLIVRSQLRM
jgi:hypothetical protein